MEEGDGVNIHEAIVHIRSSTRWEAPVGCVKMNVDVAWLRKESKAGAAGPGMVIWDAPGQFLDARSVSLGLAGS